MNAHISLLCLLVTFLAPARVSAEVKISKIDYNGWPDCYEMSNGTVKVVVVPQIGGRIMEYSLAGENVIWQNKSELGKTSGPDIGKKWRNYGGYKAWNAPQGSWSKKDPDWFYDSQPAHAEIIPGPGIRVTVNPMLRIGIQFTREIYLSSDTSRLRLVEKMKNVSFRNIAWSVWDVTQVNVPCWMAFPVNEKSKFPLGWNVIMQDTSKAGQITRLGKLGVLQYKDVTENWATDAGEGWMAYMKGLLAYVKRWSTHVVDATYPDGGCDAAFFTADKGVWGGYAEMEVMGPIVKLKPGEETQITEDWYLTRMNQAVKDVPDVINRLKLLQKRGLLPKSIEF